MSRIAKVAAVALGTSAVVVSGAGLAMADSGAQAAAVGSPGVLSGNVVQAPIHVPINVCGNTISIIGALNPAFGNKCANVSGHHHKEDGYKDGGHKDGGHKDGGHQDGSHQDGSYGYGD
ncbi:hypothetical protein JCM4814A_68050 [Streptomyces phaeofaciens JCM 4814]|uniref:Chaplin domain-containing protein n=1 Tax=Streptomyces phaeofaciens TaxID=68254 RepID=A0A918LR99_9ACTN|nr:chaplin [Streptomyces phaeofaciens]GGT40948.1 hypothetical protein GCM10010226_16700 [Streptomyces phaeofaciens]